MRRATTRALAVFALIAALAGCKNDEVEFGVVPVDTEPGDAGSANFLQISEHLSTGNGRALTAATGGDPPVTVVVTTVGLATVRSGEAPTELDQLDAADGARAVAVAPGGNLTAVALDNPPSVRWYDLASGLNVATTDLAAAGALASLWFTPDGTLVGQSPTQIVSWPAGPSGELSVLADGASALGQAAVLADGRLVVPLLGGTSVLVGPLAGPLAAQPLTGVEAQFVHDAHASPGGTLAVTVSPSDDPFERQDQIAVVDTTSWAAHPATPLGAKLDPHGWGVTDAAIVVAGQNDLTVYGLDGSALTTLQPSPGDDGSAPIVSAVLADAPTVAAFTAAGVALWEAASWTPLPAPAAGAYPAVQATRGAIVTAVGEGGHVSAWRAADGSVVLDDPGFGSGELTSVTISAFGTVAAGSTTGRALLFDSTLTPTGSVDTGRAQRLGEVAFAPNTESLYTGLAQRLSDIAYDDTVTRWDSGTEVFRFGGEGEDVHGCAFFVSRLAFSPDGALMAAISHTFEVLLVDPVTGAEVHRFEPHASSVFDVAFTPEGYLVTSADDATTRVWDTTTHVKLAEYPTALGGYHSIAPLGNGTMAVTDITGSIHVVDVLAGAQRAQFAVGTTRDGHLALSPDGTLLAAPGATGGVAVWAADSYELLGTLAGPSGAVTDVVFADGDTILATSADGTVHSWTFTVDA